MPDAVATNRQSSRDDAVLTTGYSPIGKTSAKEEDELRKSPPAEGLSEEKKDGLLRALKALADKPCPWYSLMKFNNKKEGNFWGLEEIKELNFSSENEDAVIRFVTENGWRKEESEWKDRYVLAPASFVEQGGIVAAVREKYIECAKEALKESLGRKRGKGAKLDGQQLRNNTDSFWNKKGYPSADEKIDAILLKEWTIPFYVGTDLKQQKRYENAISELRERGFVVEKKSNKCYYSLAEESVVAQKADVQGSSRDSAPTSRGGDDDMKTLICKLINEDGVIAEPRLRKKVLSVPGAKASDYKRAILSFKDQVINKGLKPEDSPLGEHDVFVSFEKFESLEQIIQLQNVKPTEYLTQLNGWLTSRVEEEVKEVYSLGGNACMDQAEFIQFLQDKFPDVFSPDGIQEFFWDRHVNRMGIVDDPEDEEDDF